MAENQKEKLMRILGCSADEAEDIIATDRMIDQGKRTPYDLSKEEEKAAIKYANCTDKQRKAETKPRERKENPTKGGIIAELAEFLEKSSGFACQNVEITNKERQIAFVVGENRYELTLVQKRASKN